MDKKSEAPPPPPPSVGDYDDSQSTYTVDQPPPAYRKPDLPAVKMAKIVAATVLIVTFIIGLTSVAIVYMQHNMKCAEMVVVQQPQDSSRLPMASKVVQEEEVPTSKEDDDDDGKFLFSDLAMAAAEDKLKQLNFPIHIDMDELTGKMMEKNQRARLNCVIEKKRSEEIIPRSPKTLQTPFGNLTTDPKFTHVTGETMSLTCRSGNDRVSRPVAENGSPILIEIPIQRGSAGLPMPPMHRQMPQGPARPSVVPLLGPLNALHQLQQQAARGLGNMPQLHAAARPQVHSDQEQQQQRLLPQLAQHFPMPLMPLPQIPLHQVIPQLLEVHKQIQQERQREEQEQQQQKEQEQQPDRHETRAEGRAIPIHDIPLEKIPTAPFPIFPHLQFEQHQQPNQLHHHQQQQQQQQQQQPNPLLQQEQQIRGPPDQELQQHHQQPLHEQQQEEEQQQQQQQHIPLPHHQPQIQLQLQQQHQQRQQQHSQEENEQENQGPPNSQSGPLDGAHSFHDGPQIVPADMMMMSRMQPSPFLLGSHNMQPRSSARPRMKRMAGSCSCVCK